jgi:hypothetical protein
MCEDALVVVYQSSKGVGGLYCDAEIRDGEPMSEGDSYDPT